jgi:hypothetical protein
MGNSCIFVQSWIERRRKNVDDIAFKYFTRFFSPMPKSNKRARAFFRGITRVRQPPTHSLKMLGNITHKKSYDRAF